MLVSKTIALPFIIIAFFFSIKAHMLDSLTDLTGNLICHVAFHSATTGDGVYKFFPCPAFRLPFKVL